jgi:hypothetical protein
MKNSACRTAARFAVLTIFLTGVLFVSSCSKNDNKQYRHSRCNRPSLPGQWMIHYYFNVTEQSANYVDYTLHLTAMELLLQLKQDQSLTGPGKKK